MLYEVFFYDYQMQESIRNSADCMLLSAPDLLSVSITRSLSVDSDEQTASVSVSTPHKSSAHSFGIDGLDMLKFTYRVSF